MSSTRLYLNRNFEIISRLFVVIGQDVFDRDYRPNRRTVYTGLMIAFALVQVVYLLWTERSNMLQFLEILPNLLFTLPGLHKLVMIVRDAGRLFALRIKLTEIQELLDVAESNRLIICKVLRVSHLLQKVILALYLSSAVIVITMPFVLWLVLGRKTLMFVFFVPGINEASTEGFLLHLVLHAMMMPAAFCGYTGHECMFLAFIMPIAAYVDVMGNEVKELNSMLSLKECNDPEIHDQLQRIVKLHQLLSEYEANLEDLYNGLFLDKIGLNYLGIISTLVVMFKSNDRMAYIFFALMFDQLTQSCLMGTIVTVKNEQLMGHLYAINWYQLHPDQAQNLRFMLHNAQNPTCVTIGKYVPLNLESYMRIIRSMYTYVMILITLLDE